MNQSVIIFIAIIAFVALYFYYNLRKMKRMPVTAENNKIIHLNDKNFNQTTKNGIALIDFWAEWCMPCRMMTPILNEIADEVDNKVKVCKINVDIERNLASKFSVRSIPTLLLIKNGKVIERFVGVKQKGYLLGQINKYSNN